MLKVDSLFLCQDLTPLRFRLSEFGDPLLLCVHQARRQDVAAGWPKTRRRGQNQKGGHIFKIQYWMYGATGGPNVKWGAPISNGGSAPLSPPAGDGPGVHQP